MKVYERKDLDCYVPTRHKYIKLKHLINKEFRLYKHINHPNILSAIKAYNDKKYKKIFIVQELM